MAARAAFAAAIDADRLRHRKPSRPTSSAPLFPSLAAGFGHVVLQAMASAVMMVGIAGAAAQRLVVDGFSGCLVLCADPAAGVAMSFAGTLERALA